jgi:hypothetical protein
MDFDDYNDNDNHDNKPIIKQTNSLSTLDFRIHRLN